MPRGRTRRKARAPNEEVIIDDVDWTKVKPSDLDEFRTIGVYEFSLLPGMFFYWENEYAQVFRHGWRTEYINDPRRRAWDYGKILDVTWYQRPVTPHNPGTRYANITYEHISGSPEYYAPNLGPGRRTFREGSMLTVRNDPRLDGYDPFKFVDAWKEDAKMLNPTIEEANNPLTKKQKRRCSRCKSKITDNYYVDQENLRVCVACAKKATFKDNEVFRDSHDPFYFLEKFKQDAEVLEGKKIIEPVPEHPIHAALASSSPEIKPHIPGRSYRKRKGELKGVFREEKEKKARRSK